MPELQWDHKILNVKNPDFDALALEIFNLQAQHNPIYKAYLKAMNRDPEQVTALSQIPFLPIGFFKTHTVLMHEQPATLVFESSGTTATVPARHSVADLNLYEQSFIRGFEIFYGPVKDWCIIGLLPSYLERKNSSLVYMVDRFIKMSQHPESGFYLDEFEKLSRVLGELENKKTKTLLIGVSFALLDFAEQRPQPLKHTIIMETGGMKGRREEMIRPVLHDKLKSAFNLDNIHSEYGMTELLSQAYSKGEGIFNCPPWMKILVRDDEDPLLLKENGLGAINVIDLANIHSCSFIATDDVGKLYSDGSFEVLGRMDGSDLRGCSLLVV